MNREKLRKRYDYRCGYCNVHEDDAGALLTADDFQPKTKGGADDDANGVYSCHACNEYKKDYWNPTSVERILHPLYDEMTQHIVEAADCRLVPLTETGRFHIETLRLNRSALIA